MQYSSKQWAVSLAPAVSKIMHTYIACLASQWQHCQYLCQPVTLKNMGKDFMWHHEWYNQKRQGIVKLCAYCLEWYVDKYVDALYAIKVWLILRSLWRAYHMACYNFARHTCTYIYFMAKCWCNILTNYITAVMFYKTIKCALKFVSIKTWVVINGLFINT